MQPGPLRRLTRRAQPRPAGTDSPSHTSAAAAFGRPVQLSTQYLAILRDNLDRAHTEQALWSGETFLAAEIARDSRNESRRQAHEEASRRAEQQRQEQQRIHDRTLAQQRARAAEREERQRQERERLRQEQEEAEQRRRAEAAAEETERRRRERLRECVACMDENDVAVVVQAPCQHWYCRTCLRDGIQASLASRSVFQCCQRNVPITLVADLLSNEFQSRYELMQLEQTTPNPTYCANTECGAFIPPVNYHGPDSALCLQCQTDTCRHCRARGHVGRGCTADQATAQVRALAAVVGWKECPRCGTMVERRDGCLHMTCRAPCRAEFCYRCGGFWESCRSNCGGGGRYF